MTFFLDYIKFLSTFFVSELIPQELETQEESSRLTQMIHLIPNQSQINQMEIGEINGLREILILVGAVILLFIIAIWIYTRFCVITPNNEAFVRTGGVFKKSQMVILKGGCIVLPGFHEITRVPLREISIDIVRNGNLAVRTQDYLRASMRVTFYVCIDSIKEDINKAASCLSRHGKVSETEIKEALEKRANDAIVAAAKWKTIAEIDSDKTGFAQEILDFMEQDLKKVGLTLNNITLSEIEESNIYDENNFFDAQGIKLRTEIIQQALKEKKEIELNTQVAIEQKELAAEKQSLEITKEREFLKTQKQLAIQQSQIETNIALEEQNKQQKVAEIICQKTIDISRLQAQVEVALAEQDAEMAIAYKEKERFNAEAERAQAEVSVITATAVEKAEGEKRLSLINAEQEAQKRRITDNNVVEIETFRRCRQAEIARQSAEAEAESIRILADAHRYKALAEIEARRALIETEKIFCDTSRTAELIKAIWPDLEPHFIKQIIDTHPT